MADIISRKMATALKMIALKPCRCPTVARSSRSSTAPVRRVACSVLSADKSEIERVAIENQIVRDGDLEIPLVKRQASKKESDQIDIGGVLELFDEKETVDVCVVGCGPAGLALSGELGRRGLKVCLVGPESKFTNNYGVWVDEFKDLGLEHLLDNTWKDSICYFLDKEKKVNRAYGRLSRKGIRDHLLGVCREFNVKYVPAMVTDIDAEPNDSLCIVMTDKGSVISTRLVNLAAGAVSAKFLKFETDAPAVAAQTAYGIEAVLEGYNEAYDPETMLFMDYRRCHSGMWPGSGKVVNTNNDPNKTSHPNWNGNIGTGDESPSFLYAMPLKNGNVFLEETCLVARPGLPFETLKRRLYRRCEAMGITVKEVTEEEWSYIPVGGPMPVEQCITAFGAAANMVHPATGYSIARTLKEAGPLAEEMATTLAMDLTVGDASKRVWQALWPQEKRRQVSFHVFGMELLATLDVNAIHEFFETFFNLPDHYWRGFLAARLSSTELLAFAGLTFATCSFNIRFKLMEHLFTNPAGAYLFTAYTEELKQAIQKRDEE